MPLRQVPDTDLEYYLLCFDEKGAERTEDDGTLLSAAVAARLAADPPVTDIFVTAHGWKGDVPGAIASYDLWITTMAKQTDDHAAARQRCPAFTSLVVALHWPSLPWGDETIPGPELGLVAPRETRTADVSTAHSAVEFADEAQLPVADLVDRYASRIADTDTARAALKTILSATGGVTVVGRHAGATPEVTFDPEVAEAYHTLFAESGLSTASATAAPGNDQDQFAPEAIVSDRVRLGLVARTAAAPAPDPAPDPALAPAPAADPGPAESAPIQPGPAHAELLGLGGLADKARDLLLTPIRQLSFWQMKARARTVGESGGHALLLAMQAAAPGARVHLMGHSFGCILATATVCGPVGPNGAPGPARPVQTLFLVQGAMSLWSVADSIPYPPSEPGYYEVVRHQHLVSGPIVTTRSKFDKAVGVYYPLAAAAADEYQLVEQLPKFGGIGAFGVQGFDLPPGNDVPVLPSTGDYGFAGQQVYNIDADTVICHGGGASGAHSDIAHPEIAHVFWSAALVSL